MQKNSVYNKDFVPMRADHNPPMNPNAGFKPENPIDLGTIHNVTIKKYILKNNFI
jgi:hypothetical protein